MNITALTLIRPLSDILGCLVAVCLFLYHCSLVGAVGVLLEVLGDN